MVEPTVAPGRNIKSEKMKVKKLIIYKLPQKKTLAHFTLYNFQANN